MLSRLDLSTACIPSTCMHAGTARPAHTVQDAASCPVPLYQHPLHTMQLHAAPVQRAHMLQDAGKRVAAVEGRLRGLQARHVLAHKRAEEGHEAAVRACAAWAFVEACVHDAHCNMSLQHAMRLHIPHVLAQIPMAEDLHDRSAAPPSESGLTGQTPHTLECAGAGPSTEGAGPRTGGGGARGGGGRGIGQLLEGGQRSSG